jgi:hypothetical protein
VILTSLLVAHGIICVLGAFFPFYPPVFLFYWFLPGPFAMKLVIVLVAGVFQVVFGVYLALRKKGRQVRWYWLAIMVIVPVVLLLVFPIIEGQFP